MQRQRERARLGRRRVMRRHPGRAEKQELPPHGRRGVGRRHAAEVEALSEAVLVERGGRRGRHEESAAAAAAAAEAPRAVVVGPAVVRRRQRHRQREAGETKGAAGVDPALPVDEEAVARVLGGGAGEGDGVPGDEALLLDEAAPALGHDVALAAVPVGVAEAPVLAGAVLEAEEEALLVGRRVQREVLLRVLLRDHQPVELPHVARRDHLVEHVLLLHRLRLRVRWRAAAPRRSGGIPRRGGGAEGGAAASRCTRGCAGGGGRGRGSSRRRGRGRSRRHEGDLAHGIGRILLLLVCLLLSREPPARGELVHIATTYLPTTCFLWYFLLAGSSLGPARHLLLPSPLHWALAALPI
jgi:hypothetical protein